MGEQSRRVHSDLAEAAAHEARRLSEKYGKDFLSCEDLVTIMGVGTNNVRYLMCSDDFPVITIGNRKVVSVLAFVLWSMRPERLYSQI